MKTFVAIAAAFTALSLLLSGCSSGYVAVSGKKGSDNISKSLEKNDANAAEKSAAYALVTAAYPEMHEYPDETKYFNEKGEFDSENFDKAYSAWNRDIQNQASQNAGYTDGMSEYNKLISRVFLQDKDGENCAFSPLNIYMALALLAEVTDGRSREQILDVLGTDSTEALREKTSALWNAAYRDDGAITSILANSVWMDKDLDYVEATLNVLADVYQASSFIGEMGDDEYSAALQSWLNEQTGGLLEEQASELKFDRETVLALASTIYFRAKWTNTFSESNTYDDTFHAPSGDVQCDFMHARRYDTFYSGDGFTAAALRLENRGVMYLFLPDEGKEISAIIDKGEIFDLVAAPYDWKNSRSLFINWSVPKFDISSGTELNDPFEALGITDVFDKETADFSPIINNADSVFLSKATHAARVAIDEDGCTAAAFTVMMTAGSALPPPDEVDFVLDRPFFFAVTGADQSVLFAGTVYDPN